MSGTGGEGSFSVSLVMRVRPCTGADLSQLEWFGLFSPHRALIRDVFRRQGRGETLILVVDSQGVAVGQVWLDFVEKREQGAGVLWALRVMPGFQGAGLGTRLVHASEREMAARGLRVSDLEVEKDNTHALAFYLRLGYQVVGESSGARDGPARVGAMWRMQHALPPQASGGHGF